MPSICATPSCTGDYSLPQVGGGKGSPGRALALACGERLPALTAEPGSKGTSWWAMPLRPPTTQSIDPPSRQTFHWQCGWRVSEFASASILGNVGERRAGMANDPLGSADGDLAVTQHHPVTVEQGRGAAGRQFAGGAVPVQRRAVRRVPVDQHQRAVGRQVHLGMGLGQRLVATGQRQQVGDLLPRPRRGAAAEQCGATECDLLAVVDNQGPGGRVVAASPGGWGCG